MRLKAKRAYSAACQRSEGAEDKQRKTYSISDDDEAAHGLGDGQDLLGRLFEDLDPRSTRCRGPRAQIGETLGNVSSGHHEVVSLEDGLVVLGTCRCRSNVGLQAAEKGSEDGAEEGDLLLGDLVEDGDESADCFEEVKLRVEEGRGAGSLGEEVVGGSIEGGELGGDVEEVLWELRSATGEVRSKEVGTHLHASEDLGDELARNLSLDDRLGLVDEATEEVEDASLDSLFALMQTAVAKKEGRVSFASSLAQGTQYETHCSSKKLGRICWMYSGHSLKKS